MKDDTKKIKPVEEAKSIEEPVEYYRLMRAERNMFCVETVTLQDGKIVKLESDEPTYLPISFDKLRRKTGEAFFKAIKENA